MNRKIVLAAALAFAALPAPALAAGNYHVRNDTPRTLACGLRRERSEIIDNFELRPGAGWSQATPRAGNRTLICYVGQVLPHFRLHSGLRYALVDQGGRLALRIAGPAR
jgi:hypothetical protein